MERPVRLLFQRPEPGSFKLHHQRQPDHDPAQYPGTSTNDRSVPQARPRSVSGPQRWADVLDAGRLHDEFLLPLCAANARPRSQLYSQFGEDRRRCLSRNRRLLSDGRQRPGCPDLPTHLSELVQAFLGHAGGPSEAHSLSGGPLSDSGAALSNLPHGGRRGFL